MEWHGMSHLPNFTVFIYTTHSAFWSPHPTSPSSSFLCVSVDCSLGHRRNLRKENANLIPYKCPRLGMEGPRSPSMACSAHRTTHAWSSHHFCAAYIYVHISSLASTSLIFSALVMQHKPMDCMRKFFVYFCSIEYVLRL